MFLNRAELLPEDETTQEHETGKADEARVLAADRSSRGLFKGIFTRPPHGLGHRPPHLPVAPHPIWDEADHVERCPACTHELEDGMCNRCGWEIDAYGFSDEDDIDDLTEQTYNSEEDDRDISPDDDGTEPFHPLPFGFHVHHDFYDQESQAEDEHYAGHPFPRPSSISLSEDGVSEDEDDDGEMDDFIDDDEEHDHPREIDYDDEDLDSLASERRHPGHRSPHPGHLGPGTEPIIHHPASTNFAYDSHYDTSSEIEEPSYDEDDAAPSLSSRPIYNIDYNSESSGDEDVTVQNGDDSQTDDQTNYDSDGSSVQEVPPPSHTTGLTNRRGNRRIVDSDDEEEDGTGVDEQVPPPFSEEDSEVSEESDDTAIRGPPQSSALRQRRLRQRRATHSQRSDRGLSAGGPSRYSSYSRSPPPSRRRGQRLQPVLDLTQSRPMRVH